MKQVTKTETRSYVGLRLCAQQLSRSCSFRCMHTNAQQNSELVSPKVFSMTFEEKLTAWLSIESSKYPPRRERLRARQLSRFSPHWTHKQNFELVTSATALLKFYRSSSGVWIATSRYTRLSSFRLPGPFHSGCLQWLVVRGLIAVLYWATGMDWSGQNASWAALLSNTQARANRQDGVPNRHAKQVSMINNKLTLPVGPCTRWLPYA